MAKLLFPALLAVLLVAACSSSKSSPTATAPVATTAPASTTAPQSTVAAPSPTVPAGGQLSDLSIVYIDTRAPGQAQVWLAAADGTKGKQIAVLQQGAHALDLNYNLLLVNTGIAGAYQLVDLTTGQVRSVAAGAGANDARLLNANTLLFTTRGSCGGGTGPTTGSMVSMDLTTMVQKTLFTVNTQGISIVGFDTTAGTVAITPRGCDVGTSETRLYKLSDGSLVQAVPTMGCGGVGISFAVKQVLASRKACTVSSDHAGADATVYDYSTTPATAKDVMSPAGGANNDPFILRPGKAEAALGTGMVVQGPGGSKGSGIWLLDLNALTFSPLQPAAGAEQYPVGWSTNGAYLLTATVQAQGVCGYSVIDVAAKKVQDVSTDVSQCGANGQVVGFTELGKR